ncbi:MAG: hypothetical protein L3J13_04185, partial [Devosiaceae bacterium]|nr:hypothetical protein [Devosiaceae bacterium]
MNQNLNIAAPGATSGIDALLGGASRANEAPEGLFSSLVSILGGNNGPKVSELVQIGSPAQTGEAWINLQLGDASLSLSAQALTTAMSPEKMASMVPGILDDLQLDDAALQGLSNLGQAVREAIQTPTGAVPATQLANTALGLQEAAPQQATAQQTAAQQAAAQLLQQAQINTASMANFTGQTQNELTGTQMTALEENLQNPALVKNLTGQNQSTGIPLTPDQIASRDSLAAQLQRQMGNNTEQQQLREQARVATTTQQNSASGQNTAPPGNTANTSTAMPAGFAASLSQLQF